VLLNIANPQQTCCGQEAKYGKPCGNLLNTAGRARAESLFYKMDRQKFVSPKDLRELAEVMLCNRYHNSLTVESRRHCSQVEKVFAKWSAIVRESEKEKREVTVDVHETNALLDNAFRERDEPLARVKIQQEQWVSFLVLVTCFD